jgi:hypothetical protein
MQSTISDKSMKKFIGAGMVLAVVLLYMVPGSAQTKTETSTTRSAADVQIPMLSCGGGPAGPYTHILQGRMTERTGPD